MATFLNYIKEISLFSESETVEHSNEFSIKSEDTNTKSKVKRIYVSPKIEHLVQQNKTLTQTLLNPKKINSKLIKMSNDRLKNL